MMRAMNVWYVSHGATQNNFYLHLSMFFFNIHRYTVIYTFRHATTCTAK